MKRKSWLIISLFTILFVFNCFNLSYDVKATSDVNYTFIDNVLYESDDIELSDSFNLQNESIATELYNGTYSFEDDEIGEFPLEWVSYNEATINETFVSSDYKGHNKILTLENDTDIGLEQVIDPPDSSIIEFWVLKEFGLSGIVIEFYNDIAINLTFMIVIDKDNNGLIREYEGSGVWETITNKYADNVWIHVKISFNDVSHLLDVYVNGILEMEDNPYVENVDIGLIRVRFGWSTVMSKCRFDAIGYSWDNYYNINDNIVPIFNTTSNLVVAKDEFAYDANGEFYKVGVKDACEWEGNDIDYTYLIQSAEPFYDKDYKIHCEGTTANKFIRKYYNINDGVYNFTLNISYLWMLNIGSSYWWTISSTLLNITAVIEIIHIAAGQVALRYLDDIDAETYTLIGYIDFTESTIRKLTLFIGDLCYLTYKDAVEYYEVIFPKLEPEEEGLYEVSFAGGLDDTSNFQTIYIDNIGVFCNGTNLNDDFGSSSLDLDSATWYSKRNNIININALGIFGLGVFSETSSTSLKGFYNYTNSKTWNVYNYFPYIVDPSLVFITNESFTINQIKITGVKMTDEITTFIPDFYYGSINIDESYFYVDSSNRLQFNLIANDNYTEWIELRFFTLIKTTENRSIQFKSNIDGISVGYVHLAYWGFAYTNIYFPTFTTTTTIYLPQGYVIFTISIIISDQDITWYDDCSGYITNLKLLYSPGGILPITILTYFDISTLIIVLVPLIILIAPTLALSVKFGKKIILPMFIFMSLLCVIINLIPIWLFFIIAITCGSLIFMTYKKGEN